MSISDARNPAPVPSSATGARAEAASTAGDPAEARTADIIAALVEAVHAGDDARAGVLLRAMADCADMAALYALRDALERNLAGA
ncbi:hypothetical protein ABIA33_002850 [Streptacidiphilus sp. MAP12-16]|uniref:hypothetical protein n=1 Tax=Streptacidiphilus sp. MAP12-16 TaxID=3156300 RepID=UPI003513DE3B